MSSTDRPFTLGGTKFYLKNNRERPYLPRIVAVLPNQTDIPGSPNTVSPDPLKRFLTQSDWSGGAGFLIFDASTKGFHQAHNLTYKEDTQALVPAAQPTHDASFTDGGAFALDTRRLTTSANALSNALSAVVAWTASDAVKAASDPTSITAITDGSTTKTASSYTNGDVYENASVWKNFATGETLVTAYEDLCYVLNGPTLLDVMDGFLATATSTVKDTTVYNNLMADTATNNHILTVSDVGPVWLVEDPSGQLYVREYNVGDASAAYIAELPSNALANSIHFAHDTYWVPYETNMTGTSDAQMYLWFMTSGTQGRVGPFLSPDTAGSTSTLLPIVLGVGVDNKILILWRDQIWGYDPSTAALSQIVNAADDIVLASGATTIDGGSAYSDVACVLYDNGKVGVYEPTKMRTTGTLASLGSYIDMSAWDYGYPGIIKQLVSVSVSTAALNNAEEVGLAYRFDNASAWTSATAVHDVDGATTFTWYPSVEDSTKKGDLIQLRLVLNGFGSGPTIHSISSSVMPDESHQEWQLEIDTATSNDGTRDSEATLAAIAALPVQTTFVNPYEERDHEVGVSHNVRILSRELEAQGRDGPQYSTVILRKVETV